jgi:hypothetical protein
MMIRFSIIFYELIFKILVPSNIFFIKKKVLFVFDLMGSKVVVFF